MMPLTTTLGVSAGCLPDMYETRVSAPLVVITGPTAVGKTALALELASELGGEIVSADSRQVYRRMDIGTAKPTPLERRLVRHHVLDVVDPDQPYSVALYQEAANAALEDIAARGKVPLLVGGSPHYLQALIEGLQIPRVEPDMALRAELEAEAHLRGREALHRRLAEVDPPAAAAIHPNNLRRVIRALEVCLKLGEPVSQGRRRAATCRKCLEICLVTDRRELYRRIDARIDAMMKQGFLEEVEGLLKDGYDARLPSMSAAGYKELCAYLAGEMTLSEALERTQYRVHAFARHQHTWFRRNPRLVIQEVAPGFEGEVLQLARNYLRQHSGTEASEALAHTNA